MDILRSEPHHDEQEVINNVMNLEENEEKVPLTDIQQFYDKGHVFVTGGTGFLGKILIEKLLRSCPTVSTIYVLIRNKKGKNLHSRCDELFDDVIFDRLKREVPKFRHKIVAVGGDCSLPDLGLSLQDRKMLVDEVDMIFHVAATVRFDEKLKLATAINVRSPQDMLSLSKEMSKLKVFMHVSTAYSNCPNSTIEEKIYPSPMDSKRLIMFTESMSDKVLDAITPGMLGDYPNTYAYTKCVAEDIVRQEGRGLPVGIFRPAIVVSTYQEPIPAWINNMYGPTGIAAGAGVGLLRVLHCDSEKNANIVPVDMCVNSLIASAWEVSQSFLEHKKLTNEEFDIPVYNFESSNDNPINWGRFMDLSSHYGLRYPSIKGVWLYTLHLEKSYPLYLLYCLFLHFIPALIVDVAMTVAGKGPKIYKVYKKIFKFSSVISYFCTRQWEFKSKRVQALVERMSEDDQNLFFCDLKKLDWVKFFESYLMGVRVYLIQDPIETVPAARKRYFRFQIADYLLKTVVMVVLLRFVYLWFLQPLLSS